MARAELSALSLDMTQVKVNNIQKYKSGTIKFVPKDVFVLHGRKKANVADQSINNDLWFNLPNRVWGNIAATYEIANRDDYYSGTNASSSFGRFAGTVDATNYIKALSTEETTYTQSWNGTTITGSKAITLANSLYFYVLPNDQTKAVREFITQGVDVIAIAPVTETGWETVLKEAKKADIPVITVDRQIKTSDDSLITAWVGSDFKKEGVKAAEWLIKEKGKEKGDVNIAVLQGTIGSSAEIGRTKGFKEGIKDQKNFKIIASQTGEFTQAKGQEVMESFLKQNKDIDVVVAQNDNMAFGAIDALKAAGKTPGKDVTIISFDAIKAALKKVQSGEINAEFECNPLHGPRVAELAKKIMKGEKVDKIQYVDEQVFTKDNTTKEVINKRAY
mgnify:CR=1 FL=1